MKATHDLK